MKLASAYFRNIMLAVINGLGQYDKTMESQLESLKAKEPIVLGGRPLTI